MAKVWLPGLSGRLSKSLAGQVTYQTFKGIQTARKKPVPTGAPTQAQLDIRTFIKDFYKNSYGLFRTSPLWPAFERWGKYNPRKLTAVGTFLYTYSRCDELGLLYNFIHLHFYGSYPTYNACRITPAAGPSSPYKCICSWDDLRNPFEVWSTDSPWWYPYLYIYGPYDRDRVLYVQIYQLDSTYFSFNGITRVELPKIP